MNQYHSTNCECCKDKSPSTDQIISEISRIVGKFSVRDSVSTVDALRSLSTELRSMGGIDDIVKIASKFFSIPVESFSAEQFKLTDSKKKIGKFNISDLSDIKTVDITKIIDIRPSDVSKLESLVFSVSLPTIIAVKTLRFGSSSLKIKFIITSKDFSYFPLLDNGEISSQKKALEKLKGVSTTRPVLSSSNITLQDAKRLALNTYPSSKEINDIVKKSKTKEDFFKKLSSIGAVLYQKIDVHAEISNQINLANKRKEKPPIIDSCGSIPLSPAPFNPDELKEIEKNCCDKTPPPKPVIIDTSKIDQKNVVPDNKEIKRVELFLSDITEQNKISADCAKEKQNALDTYYWFLEAKFLNDIALQYAETRYDTMKILLGAAGRDNIVSGLFSAAETAKIIIDGTTSSTIIDKIESLRSDFHLDNLISNQVGYENDNKQLSMYVHPNIFPELSAMFAIHSAQINDTSSYIKLLGATSRQGFVADNVWNLYYSPNRIDNLFSYTEQGYTSPKPRYDEKGNLIGSSKRVTVTNALGATSSQEISNSTLSLNVNQDVAIKFWKSVENNTLSRINSMLSNVTATSVYHDTIRKIVTAASNEARYYYTAIDLIENSKISKNILEAGSPILGAYKETRDSLYKLGLLIDEKLQNLISFISVKNACILKSEKKIINIAKKFSGKSGVAAPTKDACTKLLGSDPIGLNPPSDCPGITKNCYWEEYTKLMQLVSLMPVIDIENLNKRLFRYYPVGLQIPVPAPPGVLPTLASGIPDPMISVPFPIIWSLVTAVTTPVGLMVIWMTLCGPIPGAYVLYFDEKGQPCFLVSPKGPISIPAKSIRSSLSEDKPLIEILPALKNTFKVNLKKFPYRMLMGNSKKTTSDPDDEKNFIDSIQAKIRNAISSLSVADPKYQTPSESKRKKRINGALRKYPVDGEAIMSALSDILTVIDTTLNNVYINDIKYPTNPKKLINPIVGPAEFMDGLNRIADAGVSLSKGKMSLRDKLKKQFDIILSDPDVINYLSKLDTEITALERSLVNKGIPQQMISRARRIKKALRFVADKIANKITPQDLGFVSNITTPIPLPIPCIDNVAMEILPPYVLAIMAAIKTLPSQIDSISDNVFVSILSKSIDLGKRLAKLSDLMFFACKELVLFIPEISFPDTSSATVLKQIVQSSTQNFFKVKVRMPHPGISQITIKGNLIKTALKSAVKAAFLEVINIVSIELNNNPSITTALAMEAIIKAIFGVNLSAVTGNDIKAFISSILDNLDKYLNSIKIAIRTAKNATATDFKSIKEKLFPTIPPKSFDEGPFMEIGTSEMIKATTPILRTLSRALPFPAILQASASTPARQVLTKLHPFIAKESLPSWEKLTLKNVPFVIWLDLMIATSQRQGGLASDYIVPYYLPDT